MDRQTIILSFLAAALVPGRDGATFNELPTRRSALSGFPIAAPAAERDECSIEGERCVAINFDRRRKLRKGPQQDCISCIYRCKKNLRWPFDLCPNR